MLSSISSARNRSQNTANEIYRANTSIADGADPDAIEISQGPLSQNQVNVPITSVSWQQELAASRVGRDSRASSIFSTRTPLTVQSDDARSINIEAGGQSFRISRDGSYITNTTGSPPPYPGPPLENVTEDSGEEDEGSIHASRTSIDTVRHEGQELEVSTSSSSHSLPMRTHLPFDQGESSPENRQTGFSIPQLLKSAIQSRWYGSSVSPVNLRLSNVDSDLHKSRNDLRRTQSESSTMPRLRPSQSGPVWPVDSEYEEAMSSPFLDAERQMQDIHWDNTSMSLDDQDDSTAEVSHYYNRIMRDMDKEHRKRLHERDTELSRLRELLNEKDVVYRQQLRERDHVVEGLNDKVRYRELTINELKKNAYNLENDMQLRLEKARNETEEIWEKRWKEYEALLVDRLGSSRPRKGSVVRRDLNNQSPSMTEADSNHEVLEA